MPVLAAWVRVRERKRDENIQQVFYSLVFGAVSQLLELRKNLFQVNNENNKRKKLPHAAGRQVDLDVVARLASLRLLLLGLVYTSHVSWTVLERI